jgi:hypothetical protein
MSPLIREQLEIFRRVVPWVSIPMVDNFFSPQVPPKQPLHHKPVLPHISGLRGRGVIWRLLQYITLPLGPLPTVPKVIAIQRGAMAPQ